MHSFWDVKDLVNIMNFFLCSFKQICLDSTFNDCEGEDRRRSRAMFAIFNF